MSIDVIVTRRYKGKKDIVNGGGYSYNVILSTTTTVTPLNPVNPPAEVYPEPMRIDFTDTSTPGIPDFSIYEPIYKKTARFMLVLLSEDDLGNDLELEFWGPPVRNMLDGVLTSVSYLLSDISSGYILIIK